MTSLYLRKFDSWLPSAGETHLPTLGPHSRVPVIHKSWIILLIRWNICSIHSSSCFIPDRKTSCHLTTLGSVVLPLLGPLHPPVCLVCLCCHLSLRFASVIFSTFCHEKGRVKWFRHTSQRITGENTRSSDLGQGSLKLREARWIRGIFWRQNQQVIMFNKM